MIGGTIDGKGTFFESLLALPRHWKDERMLRETALLALSIVGLEQLAHVRGIDEPPLARGRRARPHDVMQSDVLMQTAADEFFKTVLRAEAGDDVDLAAE